MAGPAENRAPKNQANKNLQGIAQKAVPRNFLINFQRRNRILQQALIFTRQIPRQNTIPDGICRGIYFGGFRGRDGFPVHPLPQCSCTVEKHNKTRQGQPPRRYSVQPRARYNFIKAIVEFYGMNYTEILCRKKGETYSEIVEQLRPDILIEDDCKSIGGLEE